MALKVFDPRQLAATFWGVEYDDECFENAEWLLSDWEISLDESSPTFQDELLEAKKRAAHETYQSALLRRAAKAVKAAPSNHIFNAIKTQLGAKSASSKKIAARDSGLAD